MKHKLHGRQTVRQKLTLHKVLITAAVSVLITGISVIILHLKHPERAIASACESSYTLDWSVPSTYTITCGDVNASNWTVKGYTCSYYSPLFNVGGNVGDPGKLVDITVRINQSGNLDGNDTAWVLIYANDVVINSYSKLGDVSAAVFSVSLTTLVPAGGTYQIVVKVKNDKSNETWQIKNGDVTACLRPLTPLPITIASFTAKADPEGKVNVDWVTFTEKNNDYFIVEHSTTGETFKEVKRVKGAGNSSSPKSYSIIHTKPAYGINYYRLTQTDFDGTTTQSTVVKANVSKAGRATTGENAINVFPNPFSDRFSVALDAEADSEISVRLLSLDGKVIFSEKKQVAQGHNTLELIPGMKIKSGNYVVQALSNETVIGSAKVICR